MTKLEDMLEGRFNSGSSQKVKALAKQSNDGRLTGFSGLFKAVELADLEKSRLEDILYKHTPDDRHDIGSDLQALFSITSEIKAITNQAAILHGERIMRAQKLLKGYKEGAFSAWLVATYGNRQTPYNFLMYYELIEVLPQDLKTKAESLPRQVMYTLASRQAPLDKKKTIISSYAGQTKQEMLELIRQAFPLPPKDKRGVRAAQNIMTSLEKVISYYKRHEDEIDSEERQEIASTLKKFLYFVK
ncbi:MAG: pGP6-D family virulence protein [Chlamydiales bacterium]|nr:pGP6-D family virulence protein [Chlamydiales bacterium]